MALAKKRSNSNRMVIIAVVALVVLGLGYLLFRQFFLTTDSSTNASTAGTKPVITNFGESILNDPRYTSLRSFDTTVNADANVDGGQINPFH